MIVQGDRYFFVTQNDDFRFAVIVDGDGLSNAAAAQAYKTEEAEEG